jgi:SAM-dependent methyltransferase
MTFSIESCPGCGGDKFDERPAIVAPFISSYVLGSPPEPSVIGSCLSCGLVFYTRRYTVEEIKRLYHDYRGEDYFRARHRFEPRYTRQLNAAIGGPSDIAARQRIYCETLAAHADPDAIETVLDYAGDRGQMMEGGPGRKLFVFDISSVAPVSGVTSLSESELEGREFDLVLLCEVAEHLSAPREEMRRVVRHIKPGGLIYVEVPSEHFDIRRIPRGGWYRSYLSWLARAPLLLFILDQWSSAMQVKFGIMPPLGFVKQHEHINFFTVASLSRLLGESGLTVETCKQVDGVIVALCRRQ